MDAKCCLLSLTNFNFQKKKKACDNTNKQHYDYLVEATWLTQAHFHKTFLSFLKNLNQGIQYFVLNLMWARKQD